MCLSFSGYSFCKPHSASYCQVSFQSAWLKAHHPAAFMAAVMSNYGGFYSTQAYAGEAQRMGIRLLGPDVNRSLDRYRARPGAIRVGLCQVKGLSEEGRSGVLDARRSGGAFKGLHDFLCRAGIRESDAERLVCAGACDSLEPSLNRPQLFWQLRCWYRSKSRERSDAGSVPRLNPRSHRGFLRAQYRMLGFLTQTHPITLVANFSGRGWVKIGAISRFLGKRVRFAGWGVTSRTVMTRQGRGMQFFTFEDETGLVETVLFPDVYERYVHLLAVQEAFVVSGKVAESFGAVVVEVERVEEVTSAS
jgi:DNA polymerase-3 subunit alpha/error-prone DNA polymerase